MTKIVIGESAFNVNQDFANSMARLLKNAAPHLKPIEPEEEVPEYEMNFGCLNMDDWPINNAKYDLTPSEAEAVAKCLEATMEYITGNSVWTEAEDLKQKATELIQKRKAS